MAKKPRSSIIFKPDIVLKPAVSGSPQLSWPLALLLTGALSILIALSWLALTGLATASYAWHELTYIADQAQATPLELISQGISGYVSQPTQTNGRENILVLGIDSLSTRGDSEPLTDTIMIVTLDLANGHLYALAIPRDTWSDKYNNKINAIYEIGLQRHLTDPTSLITQEVEDTTMVPIHHTMIVTLDEVGQLIDMVGGVKVTVPDGFIDYQFPKPDVDVTTVHDPKLLYETVEFKPGEQTMDGQRALQYIRSRHAAGIEGSDNARSVRQQLIIDSLMQQLLADKAYQNIPLAAKLYVFYRQNFAQYLSIPEAIATAKALYPHKDQIQFQGQSLSIYPDEKEGVLVHPPQLTLTSPWIYKVRDLTVLQKEVKNKLQLP